jgi:hypothetical protein
MVSISTETKATFPKIRVRAINLCPPSTNFALFLAV